MKKDYKRLVEGMAGFLKVSFRNHANSAYIASNLAHNIFGYLEDDEFFLPRTWNFKKHLKQEKK